MFAELYLHQEWADSTVWRAAIAHDDKRLRDLLAHVHMTQHAFYSTWTNGEFKYRDSSSFANLGDVLHYAREYYALVHPFVKSVTDLDQPMVMPWANRFRKDAGRTTMRETLLQVPMHSTYHRGQVNARLREIGGEPPLVDYIAWIWLGRPAPEWPSAPGS